MHIIIKKRGQYHPAALLLIPLISVVFVFGFIFLPLLADITGIQETTYFEKNFLVRDMATIINTLYASPGNIIVNYDKNTSWFSYEFNKENVAVFDETATLKLKTKYPIISNSLNFNSITLNAKFISEDKSKDNLKESVKPIFAKINDDILIKDELDKSINELKCITTEPIRELQNKIILVDAGHGGKDDGVTVNDVKEKDITGSIGFSLYQSLDNNKFFTRDNIEGKIDEQIRKSKSKIMEEATKADIIISIHTGDHDDTSNNIKAYYALESKENIQAKSKKIACEILNGLAKEEELEISGISIIGIHPEDYKGGEILLKDKIAILFEIGNIQNKESVDIMTKPENVQSISNSMIRGLK